MKFLLSAFLLFTTLFYYACTKESGSPKKLEIYLTDAPLGVEKVNVDIREIQVKLEKDTMGWITLQTNQGVIDLLTLQGGTVTQVAAGTFTSTENVKELRLILGPNNSIQVDGKTYSLTVPSGAESGLKIKIGKQLRSSLEKIIVDFDAAESVKQEPGGYKLRPVLKLK
jgi:hypothetical protein